MFPLNHLYTENTRTQCHSMPHMFCREKHFIYLFIQYCFSFSDFPHLHTPTKLNIEKEKTARHSHIYKYIKCIHFPYINVCNISLHFFFVFPDLLKKKKISEKKTQRKEARAIREEMKKRREIKIILCLCIFFLHGSHNKNYVHIHMEGSIHSFSSHLLTVLRCLLMGGSYFFLYTLIFLSILLLCLIKGK